MKTFLNSFKDKRIGISVLTDLVSILPIAGLIYLLQYWFIRASANIDLSKLQDIEQLLLTNPLLAQQNLTEIANLYTVFGVSVITILILSFAIYAVGRNYLWSKLTQTTFNFKKSTKWLLLPLIFVLLLIPYIAISFLFRILFSYLAGLFNNQLFATIVLNYLNLLLIIIFTIFIFLYHYYFRKKPEIWSSIGHSFDLIQKRWQSFSFLLLYSFLVGVIINLILLIPGVYLPYYFTLNEVLNTLVIILYLGWLRVYLLRVIESN